MCCLHILPVGDSRYLGIFWIISPASRTDPAGNHSPYKVYYRRSRSVRRVNNLHAPVGVVPYLLSSSYEGAYRFTRNMASKELFRATRLLIVIVCASPTTNTLTAGTVVAHLRTWADHEPLKQDVQFMLWDKSTRQIGNRTKRWELRSVPPRIIL